MTRGIVINYGQGTQDKFLLIEVDGGTPDEQFFGYKKEEVEFKKLSDDQIESAFLNLLDPKEKMYVMKEALAQKKEFAKSVVSEGLITEGDLVQITL